MIREGSQSKDLEKLLGVNDHTWPHCMLVSDDVHPDDLILKGHMNAVVNRAMTFGMEPVRAIALATWTAANHFRLPRRGALIPGFLADFSISPTLNPWNPVRVFKGGVETARDGKLLADPSDWPLPPIPGSPMRITRIAAEDLLVPAQNAGLRVIGAQEGTLLYAQGGCPAKNRKRICDLRYRKGYPEGGGLQPYIPDKGARAWIRAGHRAEKGALATSVAHDSHNVIAVGVTDADIVAVVSALRKEGGGMAVGAAGGELEILPLPVAGLMSTQPAREVAEKLGRLNTLARKWGSTL